MASVTVGDAEVAYQVEGAGDPFVLVHGSTGGAGHWAQVAPVMAERHRVVMPEYAGGGATVDAGGPLDLDDLVAQVLGAADDAGVERFHLAGWSLGAVVSAAVAAYEPGRVRSLGLVCGWAVTDARMRFTFGLWQELLRTDRELFARYVFADGASAGFFELVGDAVDGLVPLAAASFAPGSERHAELDTRIDIADRLGDIGAPTLVVGALHDRWVPVEHSRRLAEAISDAELVEVDSGHLVPTERAAELADLLLAHAASA